MNIDSVNYDEVIDSRYVTARTDYRFALQNLVPLIDRLDIQRNIQSGKFYTRLQKDLIKGCIMPPITLAFIDEKGVKLDTPESIEEYVTRNIEDGFILDGIQRLNTLMRVSEEYREESFLSRTLYVNILICSSRDNLLYRMITLNNGQKPMSARHQIEILSANMFEFEESETPVLTEREIKKHKVKVAFNKADFIKGYLAYLANTTNIENQKIIEAKLDELIADRILDSEITDSEIEFSDVLKLINDLSTREELFVWFSNVNNLIGFCVGIRRSYEFIRGASIEDFWEGLNLFEEAFSSFDVSKIKLGRIRRNLVSYFIARYESLHTMEPLELVNVLSQVD